MRDHVCPPLLYCACSRTFWCPVHRADYNYPDDVTARLLRDEGLTEVDRGAILRLKESLGARVERPLDAPTTS